MLILGQVMLSCPAGLGEGIGLGLAGLEHSQGLEIGKNTHSNYFQ